MFLQIDVAADQARSAASEFGFIPVVFAIFLSAVCFGAWRLGGALVKSRISLDEKQSESMVQMGSAITILAKTSEQLSKSNEQMAQAISLIENQLQMIGHETSILKGMSRQKAIALQQLTRASTCIMDERKEAAKDHIAQAEAALSKSESS